MWWLISIAARPMPSVVFSPRTSSSCMGRKRSGTIPPLTKRSVSASCARERRGPLRRATSHGERKPTARKPRCRMRSDGSGAAYKDSGHIVIVGASLAGLNAAETLRAEGFRGPLTFIGDEPYLPYDRPPLSKSVLTGWVPAEHTMLPQRETLADVEWRLRMTARGLRLPAQGRPLAEGRTAAVPPVLSPPPPHAPPSPTEAEPEPQR